MYNGVPLQLYPIIILYCPVWQFEVLPGSEKSKPFGLNPQNL